MGSLTTGFLKRALIISGMALASMATTAAPLIPIVSFLQHWDHHWYVWLPSDPVYEAVEIMAAERGPNNPPLLWVFFTERAQPKHQINYYNDAKVAAARAADGVTSQFAEIKFAMTGADGEPRGVSAGFVDFQNRHVAIEVGFDPEARLATTNAGLTDQIGHSGERLLLLFFRERGARAPNPHVTINGTDVAKPQPGQTFPTPFAAAYSNNIFVGGFPFMGLDVSFDGRAETPSLGAHFVPTGTPNVYEAAPPHTGRKPCGLSAARSHRRPHDRHPLQSAAPADRSAGVGSPIGFSNIARRLSPLACGRHPRPPRRRKRDDGLALRRTGLGPLTRAAHDSPS